jgi:hypothetical protein
LFSPLFLPFFFFFSRVVFWFWFFGKCDHDRHRLCGMYIEQHQIVVMVLCNFGGTWWCVTNCARWKWM